MPTQLPPPFELMVRPAEGAWRRYMWEITAAGCPVLRSPETFKSETDAEAYGRDAMEKLLARWKREHGLTDPSDSSNDEGDW